MNFTETPLAGAFEIDLERHQDARGFFARAFCTGEFADHGLIGDVAQANLSWSEKAGTLRGMHYQIDPWQETKYVRCTRGALFDVIIDLRAESPTFGRWHGVELTADNRKALFVPRDFAHGFITLSDDTEALYLVSQRYTPGAERGLRWNDPQFAIDWPVEPVVLSDKDAAWPDYSRQED